MQNAKDSFYMALRTRLEEVNPQRTILLRGAERPGIVMEEAEAPLQQIPHNVFVLRWTGLGTEANLAATMVAEECEIIYASTGTQAYGGLDRGRSLCAMDSELLALLTPNRTQKIDYRTATPVTMQTYVFWDEPVFVPMESQRDRVSRVARVMVYSYQEQGE